VRKLAPVDALRSFPLGAVFYPLSPHPPARRPPAGRSASFANRFPQKSLCGLFRVPVVFLGSMSGLSARTATSAARSRSSGAASRAASNMSKLEGLRAARFARLGGGAGGAPPLPPPPAPPARAARAAAAAGAAAAYAGGAAAAAPQAGAGAGGKGAAALACGAGIAAAAAGVCMDRARLRGVHAKDAALLLLAARRPYSVGASRQRRAHSEGTCGPGGSAFVGGSSQGGGSQGGGSDDASSESGGGEGSDDASIESGGGEGSDDASSESGGGVGKGPWRKPPPPYSPAGGGASVEASVGERQFSRVLHKCARCRKEFDGSDHGVGGGARSRSAAASASGGGRSGFVHWGKTRFCSAECAQSAAAEQGGLSPEEVKVTVVPRSRRRAPSPPPPAAPAAAGQAAGAPSEEEREAALKMDEHRADYASVRRALGKTQAAVLKRRGSFAAMVRLPPPPSGGGLVLAASASVGVDQAGNPDLFGAALAALLVAAAPSLRRRMQATMSTLRSEAAARERSKSLLAGERAGDEFVSALTLEAQAALRSSLDRAADARQLAAAAPLLRDDVPKEVFSGGFKKAVTRLHAEVATALRDSKNVRAKLASSMVVR
jgi:hypothetical protein